MRFSKSFIPTLREDPADADALSHKLLLRGGFIRKVAGGIYEWLPLGLRVLKKVEQIVREEMNAAGGLEVWLPVVQPKELWSQSGRWAKYGKELLRFKDRKDAEFCLAPTAEEVITSLVAKNARSWRSLPLMLYQFGTKFRDEIRPRFGLLRGREFYMKDAYSFHPDEADADRYYKVMYEAYSKAFDRLGLRYRAVEADTGPIGGSFSHEFMVLAQTGEDEIAHCSACAYAANVERAECPALNGAALGAGPVPEDIATPGLFTVDDVSKFLKISSDRFIKTMFYWTSDKRPVVCLLRGDHQLNEVKLKHAVSADELIMMEPKDYEALVGAPVGFAGPQNLAERAKAFDPKSVVVADLTVPNITDGVSGANRADYHSVHLAWGRDFKADAVKDIRLAVAGDPCPRCGKGSLVFQRGIEVGHVFKLGLKYSEALDARYLDAGGKSHPMVMGCYGIGVSRIVAAAAEQNNDASGILWPRALAPYQVLVTCLDADQPNILVEAQRVYEDLCQTGIEVLFDDREESPGVKFKDADLTGIPLRVTVSSRSLAKGGAELKLRNSKNATVVPLAEAVAGAQRLLQEYSLK